MEVLSVKYADQPVRLSSHYHDCHQILYIVSGEISALINGVEHHAGKGDLLILSRFEEHSIRQLSDEYKRYTLRISSDISHDDPLLSSVLVNRAAGFSHTVNAMEYQQDFASLLERMNLEYAQKLPMYREMLELELRRFLVLLYRLAPRLFLSQDNRGSIMIKEIQQRFEERYEEPMTLAELASDYHISPSHLSHLFKKVTGYSPMDYLQACRLSAAKRELTEGNRNIKEIVYRCGFGDESNFSRTFKERTGLTPSEFRRRYHRN